jgi:predicted transcriptional regulator
MIKEILKGLYLENLSPGEVAQRLNISPESLKGILLNMENMGYIKEVNDSEHAACPGSCSCKAAASCHKGLSYPTGKKYALTEKGKRMCCRN